MSNVIIICLVVVSDVVIILYFIIEFVIYEKEFDVVKIDE